MIKQFINNSLITIFLKFTSALLKFLIIIYITNTFGASEFGAYNFAMSVFLFINLVFRYGFDVYLQKESASLELKNKYFKSISIFFNVVWISIISVIAITLILELGLYFFIQNIDSEKYKYLSLLLIFGFAYSILWILSYYFRGIGSGKLSVFNLEILFPVFQILAIFILKQFNLEVYSVLIYSFAISIFMSILVYIFPIKGRITLLLTTYKFKFPKIQIKYILQSYPFLLVSMSSMLLAWTDIYVISYFETNENIGIYSVVTKIGLLILFPASAVSIFFSNKVVEFMQLNNYESLNKYFRIATFSLFFISFTMFILINYFDVYILSLFGEVFTSASLTLLLFSFAQLINGTAGVFESFFLMTKLRNVLMKLNIMIIIVNIILNIPLVYFYGINGAALATLIAIILNRLIQYAIIKRNYSVSI